MMRRWKTISFQAKCLWIKENKLFQMTSICNAVATFIGELWYFCLETKKPRLCHRSEIYAEIN